MPRNGGADIAIISTARTIVEAGTYAGRSKSAAQKTIRGPVEPYIANTGGAMNPFTAWTHLKAA